MRACVHTQKDTQQTEREKKEIKFKTIQIEDHHLNANDHRINHVKLR